MPERIRLLAFLSSFDVGGTERQLVALARGLDRSRFDLRVACFKHSGPFLQEVEAQGIPVATYPIRNLRSLHTVNALRRFVRDLRRERTQIVHAFNFYPNMFAIPAARLAGVPVIIATLRDMGDLWTPTQRRAQRLICRMAHRVVANANAIREQALKEGYSPEKVSVIHNGLDLATFSIAPDHLLRREALGLPPHVPVVAVFARLNHQVKGVDCFLEAAARVVAVQRDVRFLVAGDGPLRADLEALAARLGLGDSVRFAGLQSDVSQAMSAVSISVIPSQSEGLSNVLLESMAASVPVIATRVGGTPEVVEHEQSGLLVPPRDPAALAEAIVALLNDPEYAATLGRAGRRRVEQSFQHGRMVAETEALYDRMLPRHVHAAEPAPGRAQ